MSTIAFRNFSGGELDPALQSRVDTAKYSSAMRTMRNMMTLKTSGTSNRPGTEFVGEISDSTGEVKLISFINSAGVAYILEFGSLYLRVIRDGAYVTSSTKNITAITNANPGVVTAVAHGFSNGDEVKISDVAGMTQLNERNFKVANVTTDTFSLKLMDGTTDFSTASLSAYTSGGTANKIYSLVHTFDDSRFDQMQYSQQGDTMVFTHRGEVPSELVNTAGAGSDTTWVWQNMTEGRGIDKPTSLTNNGTAGSNFSWVVTAISGTTFAESEASTATTSNTNTSSSAVTLSWTAVEGAKEYWVYKGGTSGYYGRIGVAFTNSFVDSGFTIDLDITPYRFSNVPWAENPITFPGVVSHAQQRRFLARSRPPVEQQTCWTSTLGVLTNFTSGDPILDTDAITFTLASRTTSEIRHIVDLGMVLIFTDSGELYLAGDQNGNLTPSAINSRQISYNGSSFLMPLVADNKVLYVQERGNIVRDIVFTGAGYEADELSLYAHHLFEGQEITDWAFQKTPNSIIWAVRDDGLLLGLTYNREQQIMAWHRHDFDGGSVEAVASAREGLEHSLYLVITRTVNGVQKKYVERMSVRYFSDVRDASFLDSQFSYDGRNTDDSHTMSVPSGSYSHSNTFSLTSSTSFFVSTDVGNDIQITDSDGVVHRLEITAYSSATVVTVRLRSGTWTVSSTTAYSDWAKAISSITTLWHLEGKDVSVFADGFVIGSPYNPSYDTYTVTNGTITLPRPFGVIRVGLPFVSDIETLDIDSPSGETMIDKKKLIGAVTVKVKNSRGIWAGKNPDDDTSLDGLVEAKVRNEEGYEDPVALGNGEIQINLQPEWSSNGRVFIRQVDPLPLTILSISPAGLIPFR